MSEAWRVCDCNLPGRGHSSLCESWTPKPWEPRARASCNICYWVSELRRSWADLKPQIAAHCEDTGHPHTEVRVDTYTPA